MVVQLSIPVSNNDSLIGLGYSRIEVWQSTDSGDTYQEVTAASAQPAVAYSYVAETTFKMGGKLIKFALDGGTEYSVSFDPTLVYWTAGQVASRINEVAPGRAVATITNGVTITSPTTGRGSSVEITYSDDSLFPVGTKVYGYDARLTLVLGTLIYTYFDVAGPVGARYKWRYSANGVNPVSDYSTYVLGSAPPLVASGQLSVCSATFVGLDGRPRKTKLVIALDDNPTANSGLTVVGGDAVVVESGSDGFMQFTLLRGATVRVAIEGTYYVRQITVPNAASFDLISAMATAPDPFTVQAPAPFLIRRSF